MDSQRDEVGRRVLAESIELQQHVASDLAATPLAPLPRRRRPLALELLGVLVLGVLVLVVVLGLAGWLVV